MTNEEGSTCCGRDVERHMVDWWISGRNFDEWLADTFYQGKLFKNAEL